LQDFEWSPAEPLLAAYTQEVGDRPANVQLIRIPDRVNVRTKQLFNVSGEWSSPVSGSCGCYALSCSGGSVVGSHEARLCSTSCSCILSFVLHSGTAAHSGTDDCCQVIQLLHPPAVFYWPWCCLHFTDVKIFWHPQGDYLAVKVDRFTKTKKSTYTGFELFSIRDKDIPMDVSGWGSVLLDCRQSRDCAAATPGWHNKHGMQ